MLYDSAKTPTARHIEQLGRYADSFNAAVQIENSAEVQFYHKSKLVPGVETLPSLVITAMRFAPLRTYSAMNSP